MDRKIWSFLKTNVSCLLPNRLYLRLSSTIGRRRLARLKRNLQPLLKAVRANQGLPSAQLDPRVARPLHLPPVPANSLMTSAWTLEVLEDLYLLLTQTEEQLDR
jgi:hypothetical protein